MRKRSVAVIAALSVLLAACGDDDSSDDAETTSPPAETQEQTEGSAQSQETTQSTGGQQEGEADPDAVVTFAHDLVAASTGGFSFDPAAPRGDVAQMAQLNWVYGGLLRLTPGGEEVPGLAASAEIVDDTTIEVVLREGLTLSDGTPVTPEMVKASIERKLANDETTAFSAAFFSLESIEITEPNTMVFHIPDGTAATWYHFLAESETAVVPEGTDFQKPIGAGPYVVAEYVPETRIVFEKNPEYWAADEIRVPTIRVINAPADSQAGVNAVRSGQADWSRIQFPQVEGLEGTDVETQTIPNPQFITQFLVCTTMEPMDDVRVRQALSYGIDREAIVQALFGDAAVPAWDLWPEGHRYHNEELTGHYAHDPERARQLLAEAGYADGVSIDVIPIPSSPTPEVTQIVQQQWAEIGVDLNIVQSANFVEDTLINPSVPLAVVPTSGPGLLGKLSNVVGDFAGNMCGYENEEISALRDELRTVKTDSPEAVELWAQVQQLAVAEQARNIYVLFGPNAYAYDAEKLAGYELVPYTLAFPDMWQLYVPA